MGFIGRLIGYMMVKDKLCGFANLAPLREIKAPIGIAKAAKDPQRTQSSNVEYRC